MKEIKDKVAFITGGASGMGFGMVRAFLEAGMKVVIADIRGDHIERPLSQLPDKKESLHGIVLDVTDRKAMMDAADETEKIFGKVHLLCNNAGLGVIGDIKDSTYDDWDWIMNVNVNGVINGIRTFVPRMIKSGKGGHIVNTASMASIISGPGAGIYTASKFAVRGLSECLRYSLAPHGIGVSVLCPGLVKSHIWNSNAVRPADLPGDTTEQEQAFLEHLPALHEVGMDPMEVARDTLEAVRENRLYIFPHPEHKEEVRVDFEEMLAAFPDKVPDPERLKIERGRQQGKAAAKKLADTVK